MKALNPMNPKNIGAGDDTQTEKNTQDIQALISGTIAFKNIPLAQSASYGNIYRFHVEHVSRRSPILGLCTSQSGYNQNIFLINTGDTSIIALTLGDNITVIRDGDIWEVTTQEYSWGELWLLSSKEVLDLVTPI